MSIWQELRRRRVFQTAGLYIVGAWLIIQVADILFPAWSIPETAIRYLFVAAAACFPIALLFGWRYDITPRGIVRTEPADPDEAIDLGLRKGDYLILAALLGVGVAVVLGSAGKIQEEVRSIPPAAVAVERLDNSIAILPFRNLDINPETGYFSDGITEEILHRLSTLGALHVLASTSSFAFRDSQEAPASISETLGVRYLLQGSVRRDANNVRITARLLDQTGFQVWSETYDRELTGIFAIQSEIASKVSSEIVREIIPIRALPAGRTTSNMEAYNAYLAGKAVQDARTPDWQQEALAAYNRAIELDPGFAPPYAGVAVVMTVNTGDGPHWKEALGLTNKALELDPELPEALAIQGFILSVTGDPQRGLEQLETALELDPSYAVAYTWIGHPLSKLGRDDEARQMLRNGLEVDPLNPVLVRNVALVYESHAGHFERAEQLLQRLTVIPDTPGPTFRWLYLLYEAWGRLPQAIGAAKQDIRLEGLPGGSNSFVLLAGSYTRLGLDTTADYWLDQYVRTIDDPYPVDSYYQVLKVRPDPSRLLALLERMETDHVFETGDDQAFYRSYGGLAYIQLRQFETGVERLEQGLKLYQQRLRPGGPDEGLDLNLYDQYWGGSLVRWLASRLAYAYRQIGRPDDARHLLESLAELYWTHDEPRAQDPEGWESFALYKALTGDATGALDALERAIELGWTNYREIENDIAWRDTVTRPEFQALLEPVKADVERQRAIVEAADATDDIRQVVERLIAE